MIPTEGVMGKPMALFLVAGDDGADYAIRKGPPMKSDLGLLAVKGVIFHEIPHRTRKDAGSGAILSEVESPRSY